MRVSLIITTFNWKEALELSIRNALTQSHPPDEIIIADDGSSDGTKSLITKIASTTEVSIIHSWHKDEGFRAAVSRNKAIAQASGDYIILIDGDIITEKHFIEDHLFAAKRGRFIQGSRVLLNKRKTQEILKIRLFEFKIIDSGIGNRKNCLRSQWMSKIFSHNKSTLGGIKTCNFALWRQDALYVNGFNEDFVGWGREDSEFAVRLMNSGLNRYNLKFLAISYHLHHKECPRDRVPMNDDLLRKTISKKYMRCDNGISKYL